MGMLRAASQKIQLQKGRIPMSESNDQEHQMAENDENDAQMAEAENSDESQSSGWLDTIRGAALVGKASFPDQIDYYDPEEDEIV
jgi:hypothetical protein